MRVLAFAKINLSLRVLGRRADGYHELETIFQSITLHDTLTIRRVRGRFTLTCDDRDCPAGRANLVWRAAASVWKAAGRRGAPRGVSIALAKRIPMAAGLGGGSSDAAAAIRALGRLWRVGAERQRAIASSLGADIPYFFDGGTALGRQRGDAITPLARKPNAWVVLVLPSFGVSTKDAFGWFDRDGAASKRTRPAKLRTRPLKLQNDLEPVVARRHPEIRRIVSELKRSGATQASMTGSGSTVFGLFPRQNAAIAAAGALFSGRRRVLVARTLDRRSYQRLAAT